MTRPLYDILGNNLAPDRTADTKQSGRAWSLENEALQRRVAFRCRPALIKTAYMCLSPDVG